MRAISLAPRCSVTCSGLMLARELETDVLALAENRLLVFEAKGGYCLTDCGQEISLRKAPNHFEEHLYKAAGVQTSRLEENSQDRTAWILSTRNGHKLLTWVRRMSRSSSQLALLLSTRSAFANARRLFEEIGILGNDLPVPRCGT